MNDIVKDALDNAKKCADYWQPIYDAARDDLLFQSDDKYAQWDRKVAEKRRKSGRPVLTIDQLAQFVNQVSNDIRMETPSIDIIPDGDSADQETAEIFQGLIRNIEYKSKADAAYDNAVNFAIKCGIGYIRVDHGYPTALSMEQELYIERVVNPFAVLFDHDSIEPDGSDAKYAYILEQRGIEEYKKQYPDASLTPFAVDGRKKQKNDSEITIAEYFKIEDVDVTIFQDGEQIRALREGEELPEGIPSREAKLRVVRRYLLNGEDVLEETTFPGEYIPIVPVYGEECWIDGKRHLLSLIRRSKDSQRMFNYWASMETELLMRAPKGSWKAAVGTTEDFNDDYLNPDKAAVLRYKQTDAMNNPAPAPEYIPPVQIPAGIVNARMQTTQDIRATMGLYDAYLGQQDNAVSGVAINARGREGNRAVFHFADNLVRAITQVGRILVSAIPVIYDAPRMVRIIGKEDTNELVGINGMYVEGQERNYSLARGQYSVHVTTGASYSTQREEASDVYMRIVAAQPELMQVMGDLLFKYMDIPGAQAISERIKRTMSPQVLDDEQDPQVIAMQQQNEQLQQGIQLLQAQIGQLQQQLSDKQAEIQIKAQAEQYDAIADERKHALEIDKLRVEATLKEQELEIKRAELQLKQAEAIAELELKQAEATQKQENKDRDDLKEIILQLDELGNFV